ncbi:MAG: Hpt domain-containing protein [Gemmatimonadaceae bacterium]|nr:Hpt domain-containing protein [Gemmatimonadaceae bacterium]
MTVPKSGSVDGFVTARAGDTGTESAPPPEMIEALALVQRIGGKELLHKVIALFRTTSEQRLGAMHAAHAMFDQYQVSRLAHAMKGSAAQVGAESLRAAALSLEKEAQSLTPDDTVVRLATLADEAALAWAQLDAYARSVGGDA